MKNCRMRSKETTIGFVLNDGATISIRLSWGKVRNCIQSSGLVRKRGGFLKREPSTSKTIARRGWRYCNNRRD